MQAERIRKRYTHKKQQKQTQRDNLERGERTRRRQRDRAGTKK